MFADSFRLVDQLRSLFSAKTRAERRRRERANVRVEVALSYGEHRESAWLYDVSPDGARVSTAHTIPVGTAISVQLLEVPTPVGALVVHSSGTEAGLQFDQPGSGLVIAGWSKGRSARDAMAAESAVQGRR